MTEFGDEDFNAIYYQNKPNWVISVTSINWLNKNRHRKTWKICWTTYCYV